MQAADGTSGDSLTDLASVYEGLLSDEPEYKEAPETPPAQESSEPEPQPDEVESSTEPDQSEEGESEEPEQSEDEQTEQSDAPTLDPSLKLKVKVNGEEQEITLEEALKGYSRTADYTRKTQELATQRQAAEEHITAVRAERERLASQLTELEQALLDQQQAEPDWDTLYKESPEEFLTERARWSLYKERMGALTAERQRAQETVLRDRNEAFKAQIDAANERLQQEIPEWKDSKKATAEKAKMVAHAESLGYTKDELRAVVDPRIMMVLRDAMLYRELQAKKPAIQKRIETVKTATPGPSNAASRQPKSKATVAKERLRTSGSVDDLAAVYMETELAD